MPTPPPRASVNLHLSLAAHVYATHGFDQTTTERLVAAMGLSTGSFFRRFTTKEGLMHALYEHVTQQWEVASHSCQLPAGWIERRQYGYDELVGRWLGVAQHAYRYPAYFAYWQQYRAHPAGWFRLTPADRQLGPFAASIQPRLEHLLAPVPNALRPFPVSAELAGVLYLGQWTAVVAAHLTGNHSSPEAFTTIVAAAFQAWWAGLQLELV